MLAVYNTCGISGKENVDYYIEAINSLLNQTEPIPVLLSSCLNSNEQIQKIKNRFGKNINYCIIPEKHTVNITFNKSIQEYIKHYGEKDGYLYIDSGCNPKDLDIVKCIKTHFTDRFGMVLMKTDTDCGFQGIIDSTCILPVGLAVNLHFQVFSNAIQKRFGRIIPDIFRSFCTESTFPFLNAAVGKEWLVLFDKEVNHIHSLDGASSGFTEGMSQTWRDVFAPLRIEDILNQEAWECGFGYEECNRVFMHNPDCYDSEGKHKDPERLARFIEQNIFLPKSMLDYDKIECHFE